jgi:hypothetical protein
VIDKHTVSCWSAERGLHDLDVDELEESALRALRKEPHPDAKLNGEDVAWGKVTAVGVQLPVKDLEAFKPTRA